jgi:maltooligosyltrehalose trehalohydrolase
MNPLYWMEHFHIDGFRLDATHEIFDESERHILQEIAAAVRERGGYVIAEDSRNEARLIEPPEKGGYGMDAVWADDFHHVARVGQTGESEAYYKNFQGTLGELKETLEHGWLYGGQRTTAEGEKIGTECRHLEPSKFVHCLSNHDQAGNRAFGERISESIAPEAYRALSVLLCLTPYTPMLFMGQEWAASAPFLYFTDHNQELGRLVTEGRKREFAGFAAFRDCAILGNIPDPQSEETFLRSKLDWDQAIDERHAPVHALYRQCLRLRKNERAFRPHGREGWEVEKLSSDILALRYDGASVNYLLLVDPFGGHSGELAKEDVTPASRGAWRVLLSSNEERFGGTSPPSFDAAAQRYVFVCPEALLLTRENAVLGNS